MTGNTKDQIGKLLTEKSREFSGNNRIELTAKNIGDDLYISRNLASQYLNELVKEEKAVKINSWPICFLSREELEKNYRVHLEKITYQSFEELLDVLEQTGTRDFARAIGYNGSLRYCIEQCKSAIGYPGHGIPILLCGENGVGKNFLVQLMFEYAVNREVVPKEEEVVWMNCSDYQNKPEKFRELLAVQQGKRLMVFENLDRLPPEEQELLLPLLTEGLDERGRRLVFTASEKTERKILDSLLRQIPIVLQIPSLDERSPEEREELIVSCFHKESLKLHKDIYISKRVLQAFMNYHFEGNIRQLRNSIAICCANALMRQNGEYIQVMLYHLSEDMIASLPMAEEKTEDETLIPIRGYQHENGLDSYFNILSQILNQFEQLEAEKNWNDFVKQSYYCVKGYYDYLVFRKIYANGKLKAVRMVVEDVIGSVSKKYNITLSTNWGIVITRLIYQQIQNYVQISGWEEQHKKELNYLEHRLTENFPKAALVVKDLAKAVRDNLDLNPGISARILLTLEIMQYDRDIHENDMYGLIICHGYSTASSIADSVNEILDSRVFEAIDMPLDSNVSEVVQNVKRHIRNLPGIKNLLLLTDTGSLEDIDIRLDDVSNMNIGIINNVSTALALEVGSRMLQREEPEQIIREAVLAGNPKGRLIKKVQKEAAIIFVSESGIRSAERMKKLFDESMPRILPIQSIVYDYYDLVKNQESAEIFQKYNVLCMIGVFNPKLKEVPFIALEDMISGNSLERLEGIFRNYLNEEEIQQFESNFLKNFTLENVVQYLTILNAPALLNMVEAAMQTLQKHMHRQLGGRTICGLYIHICCLIERLVTKAEITSVEYENFENEHREFIDMMQSSFEEICSHYGVKLPIGEIAYVYDYIKNDNREEEF